MKINVKHRHGTSDWTPQDGSSDWLEFWEKNSHKPIPIVCPESGNIMSHPVGAHVIKADSDDKSVYITPVSKESNSADGDEPFSVEEDMLVPVNK